MRFSLAALALLALAVIGPPAAAAPLDVAQTQPEPIGAHIEYLQEADAGLDVNAARAAYAGGGFTASPDRILSFGIGAPPAWLRFDVVNRGAEPVLRLLSLETAWLDRVDIHFLRDGQAIESHAVGDALPYADRPVDDRYFVFAHAFPPGTTTVYLRVETRDPMVLPVYLTSPEQAHSRQLLETYSYGFIYGLIFALLAYNLMLYLGLRNARYLFYSLYLAAFLIMNAAYTGHGYRWLWPGSPDWQMWSNPILMLLFSVSGLLFATRFLATRKMFPRLHRAVLGGCLVFGALQALAVAAGSLVAALLLAFVFVFLFTFGMILLGAVSLRAGNKSAKYFLLASITHASGSSVTALAVWGFIPYSVLAYRAVEIGMVIDAILLALALADQFRITQAGKLRAERLASIDPLTGMKNRRAFHELVKPVWSAGQPRRRDMAVILMDIDRFKAINDTYGHARGDQVLVHVADAIAERVRTGDIPARWGGEEFILFLPDTGLDEAVAIAERLRQGIAALHRRMDDIEPLTASFGVAHTDDTNLSLDRLITQADGQLYLAKQTGRDRVCSTPGDAA
jgi:diguanylate cyclase (GGDEF)-like protein